MEKITKILANKIISNCTGRNEIYQVTIAGETGTGKTKAALETEKICLENGVKTIVFFQDAYFKILPRENHFIRVKDPKKNVGLNEVNWEEFKDEIDQAKNRKYFQKKFIDYRTNKWGFHRENTKDLKAIIIEGTYVTLLENIDCKAFISGSYKKTEEIRKKRNRDIFDENTDKILEIEHKIISQHEKLADIVFNMDGTLKHNNIKER